MLRIKDKNRFQANNILKNAADIALTLYFLFDHILLFNRIKAFEFSQSTVMIADFLSNFSWLIETISTLSYQIIEIYVINEELLSSKSKMKKISDIESEGK